MAPVKKKDNAARKRLSRAAAPSLTDEEKEEKRRKARERQQKPRDKKKAKFCSTSPENSRTKVKNALWRQHRRLMVKFNPRNISSPKQTVKPISNVAE